MNEMGKIMNYIVHRRFKDKAICGDVNIPAMTEVEEADGVILYDGKPICFVASENANQYFARNDDGDGMLRGKLTQAIQKALSKRDKDHQARWDKVWDDPVCQPYKRQEYDDYWLWNAYFYNADIDVLEHIARLVGVEVK